MNAHPSGSFVLALHGHMPWVLHHGRWPHGEHWLFEAAAGVYLPMIEVLDELASSGIQDAFSLGLTPILLEQLRHPTFRDGMAGYLAERSRRAREDERDPELAHRARYWRERFATLIAKWSAIDGDIPGAFAEHARAGRLELLSSFATHGYAPLLKHDRCIRAQLEIGLTTSERHLGFRPTGIWLPECAFRPEGPWTQPVLGGPTRLRMGVDRILEAHGVTHFFISSAMADGARSEGRFNDHGGFDKVGWDEADRYRNDGWRDVMEPHWVSTHGGASKVAAFARHPDVSEQVWSADAGYPGDPRYLEFHKKHRGDGLRYWRVTDRKLDLGEKQPYQPEVIAEATYSNAQHFAAVVRRRLESWRGQTGRDGCVTATFDAELFGHWWYEGPSFLREAILALHHDPQIRVQSAAGRLASHPPREVVWLPEGSWGDGNDHRVWLNEQTRWTWEAVHRAEDRFFSLYWKVHQKPNRKRAADLLKLAARELLLLQASDWQFVVHTGQAVDYGYRRFSNHLSMFDTVCSMVEDVLRGRRSYTAAQRACRALALASDDCFNDLDLGHFGFDGD
ncbi:MAG: 1,4-alpha-glucan branching protein [Deltaproteobacteria bacterium]|nr:1,4-alpha-glucan branching protein [Deltaproteobacteria bacterium]